MELKNLTVTEFVNITASNAPAPGGGSVSALAGALAAALSQMVANLTIGKKKYQERWEEMGVRAETLKQAQAELLEAVDKDSSAFDLYMEALTLPKDTEEQIAARKAAMENGLKAAVAVPLGVAQKVLEITPLLEVILAQGNSNAVTDGLVSVMMARTGVLGAIYNVRVNLASISDTAFVQEKEAICADIQEKILAWEKQVLSLYPLTGM